MIQTKSSPQCYGKGVSGQSLKAGPRRKRGTDSGLGPVVV